MEMGSDFGGCRTHIQYRTLTSRLWCQHRTFDKQLKSRLGGAHINFYLHKAWAWLPRASYLMMLDLSYILFHTRSFITHLETVTFLLRKAALTMLHPGPSRALWRTYQPPILLGTGLNLSRLMLPPLAELLVAPVLVANALATERESKQHHPMTYLPSLALESHISTSLRGVQKLSVTTLHRSHRLLTVRAHGS